jgi:HAD superfamily hydrolase (TIGR01509 family)
MFSVIFDMDGTLLDTQRICIPAWEQAGRLQGIEGVGDHIANVCGMNEAGWTAYLEQHFGSLDIAAFKLAARDYIVANRTVCFKAGAAELLAFLKGLGVKMAVASGTDLKVVRYNFEQLGALHLFDAVIGGEEVANGKPAPDIFLLAAERLGAAPQSCFVFEDSANGVLAAHRAGMRCVGVPDIVPFDDDTKRLLYAELTRLDEAIEIFKKITV